MPKYAAKVDANQSQIVKALRDAGATVSPTHAAGAGFPDLTVGFRGSNYLIEVKDGHKAPSARKLTKPQVKWHGNWTGQVAIVKSVPEALAVIGINAQVTL